MTSLEQRDTEALWGVRRVCQEVLTLNEVRFGGKTQTSELEYSISRADPTKPYWTARSRF